ncbi:uncharacterized protein F5891DRAFT_1179680 [Suillus fuscotomentosus]|uniref:Uncharacterized protein n=1 Tax=Suillus fuscotomentosus TaxID=1912939 RepID=A0AAD4ELB0_9AGAM|nr:uncharacterized protein F5891DRAFT_1179680 [Suillus fuscotomentosus]KAG1908161.1 hypothetical protein F5891DRAFT_1179680 [Suillus fuscotomentosus]
MNNNANANANEGAGNQIPQEFLQLVPRPRDITFRLIERQLELMYVTWANARVRIHQEIYRPELPLQPCLQPPVWTEPTRAMVVLWIARERQIFELEMEEMERLLGLRDAH